MKIYPQHNSNITLYSISFEELKHDLSDIVTIFGYAGSETPEHLQQTFDEVISQASSYCNIQAGLLTRSDIHQLENNYKLNGIEFVIGKTISRQLRDIESVVLFLCTIGPGMETWSKQLMNEGDFFKGYMADAVASQTVELAIDKVQAHLEGELFKQGLKMTNRFSPGYCGWQVSEQQKLFSLLPDNFCDVQLTESSLMLPIKSLSGIIGIGKDVRKIDYTCRLCEMTDCVYRRRFEKISQDA